MQRLLYGLNQLRTQYFLSGIRERVAEGKSIPPPAHVVWDCTRRCNLDCIHCGAVKETYAGELSTAQIKTTVDELAAMKTGMFSATGGEPLLRKDLLDVLDYAGQQGLKTGIATNGYLLDDGMADRIRDARVHSVQISLDGMQPTHNRIRGNSRSFEKAVLAIQLLIRRRVPVLSVATTVSGENLTELEELRSFLQSLGVGLWRLGVVMPIGRAENAGMSLEGEPLSSLFSFAGKHRRGKPRIYIGENLTFLGGWERRLRSSPMICPVGFLACCIGVDGHVRGCPEMPDTAANREGSILGQSLSQIWQSGFGRYRRREILAADRECAACEWKNDCFGGCWVMRTGNRHCIRRLLEATPQSTG